MQYTKPMIELVFEIRRRVPASLKPSIKLANPELLEELTGYYTNSKDTITKTLVKELFQLAGPPWNEYLNAEVRHAEAQHERPKQVTKVYRGQVTLEEAPKRDKSKGRPQRMYRGQIVEE